MTTRIILRGWIIWIILPSPPLLWLPYLFWSILIYFDLFWWLQDYSPWLESRQNDYDTNWTFFMGNTYLMRCLQMYWFVHTCKCIDLCVCVFIWMCCLLFVCCYSTFFMGKQIQGSPWTHEYRVVETHRMSSNMGLRYPVFHKRALYLVALLRKMTCNLRHPMGLRYPVPMKNRTDTG